MYITWHYLGLQIDSRHIILANFKVEISAAVVAVGSRWPSGESLGLGTDRSPVRVLLAPEAGHFTSPPSSGP